MPENMHFGSSTIMTSLKAEIFTQIVDVFDYTMDGSWGNHDRLNEQMNQMVDVPELLYSQRR